VQAGEQLELRFRKEARVRRRVGGARFPAHHQREISFDIDICRYKTRPSGKGFGEGEAAEPSLMDNVARRRRSRAFGRGGIGPRSRKE
jgi:hypothetical protein